MKVKSIKCDSCLKCKIDPPEKTRDGGHTLGFYGCEAGHWVWDDERDVSPQKWDNCQDYESE